MTISDLAYIDAQGYHYADYPTFLAWIKNQYLSIYGSDIVIEAASQDGQFLAVLAQAFYDTAALGADTYNSFSPLTAQGVGLSRNVKINGISRNVPSFSTVVLTIVGTAGSVITNGIAIDALGQKWLLPSTVTIPGGGTTTVTATAEFVGAVTAQANTITQIFTPTNGWQTVNNASEAIPGQAVETDAQLRIRQSQSTSLPALTPLESTVAAVQNVSEVTSCVGYENDTDSTDANTLPPHSICIVVAGSPNSTEVAQAIQSKKTPGTRTYGPSPTSVVVYDTQGLPITIKYQPAIAASIQVQITINPLAGWSTDFETLIAAAVASLINDLAIGGAGNAGFGGFVYLSQIYPPAFLPGTPQAGTYNIASIQLGKNGGGLSAANKAVGFDEKTVCDATTDITFIVV